jgi:hypothetical protein
MFWNYDCKDVHEFRDAYPCPLMEYQLSTLHDANPSKHSDNYEPRVFILSTKCICS